MSKVPYMYQAVARSLYDSLYLQSYDGIHRMLSRGCCGRLRGRYTRLLPLSLCADDISQEEYAGCPTRHSGELAAFVHAEQLPDVHRFGGTLHRDSARTLRGAGWLLLSGS